MEIIRGDMRSCVEDEDMIRNREVCKGIIGVADSTCLALVKIKNNNLGNGRTSMMIDEN